MSDQASSSISMEALVVRPLTVNDAPAWSALLTAQPPDYMRYFIPFQFDAATLTAILSTAHHDLYMGLWWGEVLIGFFMLRGWDQGYAIPAYGVTIDQRFRNRGLGRLTLELSRSICKLRGAKRLMLKVHPDNAAAKQLYESFGFVQTSVDAKNNNLVYHLDL
ncbi:MAG: GNAT family N-acetyltransferase [Anaerolineae bacterium]|nr:GNAT family N-acetyltransferase [Anaerolineae bacterium]